MPSGRRERIVISCVTFEVAKIVEPISYYEATKVHLLHKSETGTIYREFLDEVVSNIKETSPKTSIYSHSCTVYDFSDVLRKVLLIIEEEMRLCGPDLDIYVNVSAGTSEYSAASLMASMMHSECTVPFTVSTKEYKVSEEKVREIYYENGKPIGMTKSCREPRAVSTYAIEKPDITKVLALEVLNEQIKKGDTCAATMMSILRDRGLFDEYSRKYNNKPEQKDVMKYQRNYVDVWLENGWIEKVSKRKTKMTPAGLEILEIFSDGYHIRKR